MQRVAIIFSLFLFVPSATAVWFILKYFKLPGAPVSGSPILTKLMEADRALWKILALLFFAIIAVCAFAGLIYSILGRAPFR